MKHSYSSRVHDIEKLLVFIKYMNDQRLCSQNVRLYSYLKVN